GPGWGTGGGGHLPRALLRDPAQPGEGGHPPDAGRGAADPLRAERQGPGDRLRGITHQVPHPLLSGGHRPGEPRPGRDAQPAVVLAPPRGDRGALRAADGARPVQGRGRRGGPGAGAGGSAGGGGGGAGEGGGGGKEMVPRRFGRGERILSEGDPGQTFYVVASGSVSILTGRGVEVTRLGPGKYFGEMSLLTGEPRSATVVAAE